MFAEDMLTVPSTSALSPAAKDSLPQKVLLADAISDSRSGSDHDLSDADKDISDDLAEHLTKFIGLGPPPGLGLDPCEIAPANRTPLRSKAAVFSPLRSQAEKFVPKGLALAGGQRVTSKALGGGAEAKAQGWTTVMMRNVPHSYTCDKLIDLLESTGFSKWFDFVYIPINFTQMLGVGEAHCCCCGCCGRGHCDVCGCAALCASDFAQGASSGCTGQS